MRRALTIAALACLVAGLLAGGAPAKPKKRDRPQRGAIPAKNIKAAKRYARGRAGAVSFAIVDPKGHISGFHRGARYSSASLVKAMLMVAYLRQARGRRLHGSDKALLGPMIRASDNGAADSVMGRVGTGGLRRVARKARMRRFIPNPAWGGSQITARDQARFFFRLPSLIPDRHRSYGLGLLRRIVPGQRWGIPQGAPKRFRIHFKGGWYPGGGGWRVHQGALLRRGKGTKVGIAVLTEGGPGFAYGQRTIAGVTRRLLRNYDAKR